MNPPARPISTNRACFVGSGECKNPATHEIDTCDETEPIAYICSHHLEEFEAWDEIFANLPPEKFKALGDAINRERNPQPDPKTGLGM